MKRVASIRRLLKRLPDAVSADIVRVLDTGGRRLRAAMSARARRRSGKLAAGVKYQVMPKSLRMRVGLVGSRRARANLSYGFILDKGREQKRVPIKRGPRRGSTMLIRYLRGDRFVTGRYPELRDTITRDAKAIFTRALALIGGGND